MLRNTMFHIRWALPAMATLLLAFGCCTLSLAQKQPKKTKPKAVSTKPAKKVRSNTKKPNPRTKRSRTDTLSSISNVPKQAIAKPKPTAAEKSMVPATDTAPQYSNSEVVITSAFKPTLRKASKINFIAASPPPDTSSKTPLEYSVPVQYLYFKYQPLPLKPLALEQSQKLPWENIGHLKIGYGNYASPFLEAAMPFGNGKDFRASVLGRYVSAKGNRQFQRYANAGLDLNGTKDLNNGQRLIGALNWDHSTVYHYGIDPALLPKTEDSVRQRFNGLGATLSLAKESIDEKGLSYSPTIGIGYFSNAQKASETDLTLAAPIEKRLSRFVSLKFSGIADITHYSLSYLGDTAKADNNLFYGKTALRFNTPNVKVNLGASPGVFQTKFLVLPDFYGEARAGSLPLWGEAGYVGRFQKNTFRSLVTACPFIAMPLGLNGAKTVELYVGAKSGIGKHITANARVSLLQTSDAALFVSDPLFAGKGVLVAYASKLKTLRLKAEVGYKLQDKLTLLGGVRYNQFVQVEGASKAYGLLPLEMEASGRWNPLPKLWLRGSFWYFHAPETLSSGSGIEKIKPGVDVGGEAEYRFLNRLSGWASVKNLFAQKYERWEGYQVFGLQAQGGIVYLFR